MNFLAHAYLSFEDAGLVAGNYLGDFIKNKHLAELPQQMRRGVILHRSIDSFTDQHALVKSGTKLLHKDLGKYAPVVLDIYFDFLLSKFWNEFNGDSLELFCMKTYGLLMATSEQMPLFLQGRVRRMTEARWLENYQYYESLQRTFDFIKKRSKFPSRLDQAGAILRTKEEALGNIFLDFFPELISHSKIEIGRLAKDD